jgi:guanylate kinase
MQEMSDRDVIEGVHYKKTTTKQIDTWEKEGKTLFVRNETDANSGSSTFPLPSTVNIGKSCVLNAELTRIKSDQQIALVECSLAEAKRIHTEAKLGPDVDYIFLRPPSAQEMTVRLLRSRPGMDTKHSLLMK